MTYKYQSSITIGAWSMSMMPEMSELPIFSRWQHDVGYVGHQHPKVVNNSGLQDKFNRFDFADNTVLILCYLYISSDRM